MFFYLFLPQSCHKRSIALSLHPNIHSDLLETHGRDVWQLQNVVQRLVASHTNGHRINAVEVQEALKDVSLFTVGPQVPMVFREDDTLEAFLDRTLLGLYNHFRALAGSHTEAARMLRAPRISLYKRVKRARLRENGQEIPEGEDFLAAD